MLLLLAPVTLILRLLLAWRQPPTPIPTPPWPAAPEHTGLDIADLEDHWSTELASELLSDWWQDAYGGVSTTQEQQ